MLKQTQIINLFLLVIPFLGFGQHNTDVKIPYRLRTIPGAIGGGMNVVGLESDLNGLFAGNQEYTFVRVPSRGNLIYDFKKYLNIEGVSSLNRYRYTTNQYTYVNDTLTAKATNRTALMLMLDLHAQFSIPSLNAKMKNYFKPYLVVGPGIMLRKGFPVKTTTNIGIGFYSWITYNWGFQVQSLIKLSNTNPFIENGNSFLQHSFSIVYHLGGDPKSNTDFSKSKHPETKKKYKLKNNKQGN